MDQAREAGPEAERALVAALQLGEEAAFTELVRHHQHRVFGLCLRMLGDAGEAEDLAQDVFLTVFRSIATFRGESLLSTWIYRITRNHCLNRIKFLRRRAHEKRQPLEDTRQADFSGQPLHSPVAAEVPRPDRAAESRQIEALVLHQIEQLCPEHRELVILRDVEHLSYEEIQIITGLPEGTVKSRLHRARLELARALGPVLAEG